MKYSQAVQNSIPKVVILNPVKIFILGSKSLCFNHPSQLCLVLFTEDLGWEGDIFGVWVLLNRRLGCTCGKVPLNPVSEAAGLSQVGTGVLRNRGKLQHELFQIMVILQNLGFSLVAPSQRFPSVLSFSLFFLTWSPGISFLRSLKSHTGNLAKQKPLWPEAICFPLNKFPRVKLQRMLEFV